MLILTELFDVALADWLVPVEVSATLTGGTLML
jgi:hypothetical protein